MGLSYYTFDWDITHALTYLAMGNGDPLYACVWNGLIMAQSTQLLCQSNIIDQGADDTETGGEWRC